ncbi:MAG: hypothetical protein JWQ20_4439, partial [Conexibacter sp.]|nr:hypothetical protein [Conexibacter sp.]
DALAKLKRSAKPAQYVLGAESADDGG